MSELEIQENMSAEEAFMDTENAYEEIPEAFQKLAQLLGQDQFEVLFPDKDAKNQDEIRLVYLRICTCRISGRNGCDHFLPGTSVGGEPL